jgi:hypothetical protein
MSAHHAIQRSVYLGLATSGVVAVALLVGMGTAHADPTAGTPADELASAVASFDAENAALTAAISDDTDLPNIGDLNYLLPNWDAIIDQLALLPSTQQQFDSADELLGDDFLASLVDKLYFNPLIEETTSVIENLTSAEQGLDTAIASGSGIEAAELGLVLPDLELAADGAAALFAAPVVTLAEFVAVLEGVGNVAP